MGDITVLQRQQALLHQFTAARVLCVGDGMLDRYVYGSIDRISPEAPIPVLRQQRQTSMLGGAGNVARNLSALGAQAFLLTVVGDDAAAQELNGLAADVPGLAVEWVVDATRPTTVKTRFVASNQQMLRLDAEAAHALPERAQAAMADKIRHLLPQMQAVICSDYGKGCLTPFLLQEIMTLARSHRIPVLVDPKGRDYSRYAGATVLAPNLRELAEGSGRNIGSESELIQAAQYLQKQFRLGAVVVTRSQEGISLIDNQIVQHFPAHAREVYDVSGAGDTVMATMAVALALGGSLVDAVSLANVAGGVVVGKLGTATVATVELAEALAKSGGGLSPKLLSTNSVLARCELWRQQRYRIGFTNGVFDLLHPGHIALLQQARAACDRLIVAMNSDASVQRIKGAGRPVQNEQARAMVLSALDMVDAVVIFTGDTPLDLIRAVRPDVLIKGGDYTPDQVVGGELVQAYGGQILLAEFQDGHSTTNTVKKMAGG
jgi:D-beta-D-heptose 7-phosphate kinase / D-beta-D-heptose 1-phosphate adenosyltransferase